MPRALSRDEQAILALVRRTGTSFPIPELAGRGLLQATVYAVGAPVMPKPARAGARA